MVLCPCQGLLLLGLVVASVGLNVFVSFFRHNIALVAASILLYFVVATERGRRLLMRDASCPTPALSTDKNAVLPELQGVSADLDHDRRKPPVLNLYGNWQVSIKPEIVERIPRRSAFPGAGTSGIPGRSLDIHTMNDTLGQYVPVDLSAQRSVPQESVRLPGGRTASFPGKEVLTSRLNDLDAQPHRPKFA